MDLAAEPGEVLWQRLSQHAKSIEQAENLHLRDFRSRYLVVEDIWIPLGENMLIAMFQPLWNMLLDGFGNHDPGKGRYKQQRAPWDMVHPGRPWAARLMPNPKSRADFESAIAAFLVKLPVD